MCGGRCLVRLGGDAARRCGGTVSAALTRRVCWRLRGGAALACDWSGERLADDDQGHLRVAAGSPSGLGGAEDGHGERSRVGSWLVDVQ